MLFAGHLTLVAVDFATPDEPTIALLRHLAHLGLVAAAAAQQPAAVHPPAGLVAQTTRRSQHAESADGKYV